MESLKYSMFGFSRKYKIRDAEPPADVKEAFTKYSESESGNGSSQMSADQLLRFLIEFQKEEGYTISDAEKIVQRHRVTKPTGHGLCLEDFFHDLFFDDLNGPIKSQVHHDMTAPLQHYFIYTGHNSYLTGNQLSSDASDLPIIKALQNGVRVIELDLWPNSEKDDIHVLHGRTLTAPVTLIKCLRSIKEYAFVKSPYPVIVTLEDHLTVDLQAKVAEMVIETFGELLYYPASGCLEEFPSPEALKHRIILSTKPPKEYLESEGPTEKDSSTEAALGKESPDLAADLDPDDRDDTDQDDEGSDGCEQKSCQLGARQYKHLIAIRAGKPKNGLKEALRAGIEKIKRLSLSETALEKAAESYGTDLVRFTQKNFLRVYPKGTRVTSSNFNPLTAWMHGAQMVAFNLQGYGKSLCLMHGMFRSNGECGYVKKPDFLMMNGPNNEVFNPKTALPVKKTLKVRVYMGYGWHLDFSLTHFDSYSPPDFYTKVYIVGVPADEAKKKTKVIDDDWTPVWDEEFIFPLTVPELALLRIEVREHDRSEKDDFGGQTCLPVSELRPGIRAIPLYEKNGEKLKSSKLLMQFQFV
ncbi:Phosphoinositide phospholipase C 6 [Camellia lanceoleosa]|uniref:Phosphoinositide phospholipase C 6 n=1 Tax=Camellia lanceoleosa TaxID=1840588 RepID=A0ACC0H3K4_9ERIC|nr:Phosphoinositide phospholipase C 6 [Camellia lanceoleosa]